MGPPLTVPRKSAGLVSGSGSSANSSARLPEGTEGSSQVRALLSRARSTNLNRSYSGASEDGASSTRSASGSSVGSSNGPPPAAGAVSPTTTWGSFSGSSPAVEASARAVPVARLRSSTQGSTASAHRRARSLGGALLGDNSSPVGGPDGVDPNLVAAIRAGDADIPGGSNAPAEATVSRSPVTEYQRKSMPMSPSGSRIASLPSTPTGTVRGIPPSSSSARKRQERDTLAPGLDTSALGSSCPASAAAPDEPAVGYKAPSGEYIRPRVRSQTLRSPRSSLVRMPESPSPSVPLEAVEQELQSSQGKQPPVSSAIPMKSGTAQRHLGLGIGMGIESAPTPDNSLRVPNLAGGTRSQSPLSLDETAIASSTSTSRCSSPQNTRVDDRQPHDAGGYPQSVTPGGLSLHIPVFDQQGAGAGPISALPAINYSPQRSPQLRARPYPPSSWGFAGNNARDDVITANANSPTEPTSPDDRKRRLTLGPQSFIGDTSMTHGEAGLQRSGVHPSTSFQQRTEQAFGTPSRAELRQEKAGNQRRMSLVQTPQGIDEYARIIVQSRNAKMQKWRTANRARLTTRDLDAAQEHLQRLTLDDGAEDNVQTHNSALPPAATPNVSPTASLDESRPQSPNASQDHEIEWVDWLDEYRQLKEAKLKSEHQEIGDHTGPAADAQARSKGVSGPETRTELKRPSLPHRGSSDGPDNNNNASASGQPSPTQPESRRTGGQGPGPEGRRYGSARRPSQLSGRYQQFQDGNRSWSGNLAFGQSDAVIGEPLQGSLGRRTSILADRTRNLSLSPITSRIASSSPSQPIHGATGGGYGGFGTGRRKKLLGGKIEAWWGAVKSGFVGPVQGSADVAVREASGRSTGRQMGLSPNVAGPTREMRINSEGSDSHLQRVKSVGPSQPFGAPRGRSQTQQHDMEGDHSTMHATSSVHDLTSPTSQPSQGVPASTVADQDQAPSSDRPEAQPESTSASPRVSEGLEDQLQASQAAREALEADSRPAISRESSGEKGAASSAKSLRRGAPPQLSLHRDRAISPLEQISLDGRHSSGNESRASPAISESAEPSPKRILSDAWKPPPVKQRSSFGLDTSSTTSARHTEEIDVRGRSDMRENSGTPPSRAGSKAITFDSIRQHIQHRLAVSKETCDRDLRKVIKFIHSFAEEQLQEQRKQEELDATTDALTNLGLNDSRVGTPGSDLDRQHPKHHAARASISAANLSSSSAHLSRSSSRGLLPLADELDPDETPRVETSAGEADGEDLLSVPTPRQSAKLKEEYKLPTPPRRPSASDGLSRRVSSSSRRNQSRDFTSASSSRSHSPLPPVPDQGSDSPQFSPARRARSLPTDDVPLEPYIAPLQGLVSIAMELLDTSINTLTSRKGACQETIGSIQELGKAWEVHPHWPGRDWYVKLLLAVASLSRVVEWWEAEKGFWNFESAVEEDEQNAEPLRFIVGNTAGSMTAPSGHEETVGEGRHGASSSPVRLVRSGALAQVTASGSPSQQSSATNSPALEPIDRRIISDGNRPRTYSERPASSPVSKPQDADAGRADLQGGDLPASVKDSQNVLMELSLDGEHFLYLSPAWWTVIGSDPSELFGQSIAEMLAPDNANIFAEATRALELDDSHTVEAIFHLRVEPSVVEDANANATYYQEMEGKGMIMHDRVSGSPSHTMWVFKPAGPPQAEADLAPGQQRIATAGNESFSAVPAGVDEAIAGKHALLSVEPLLCRICERDVPAWFFEKHSEICNEIHRLEMEISESNETLGELRRTVRDIITRLDDKQNNIEYNGIELSTPLASSEPPSALEGASKSLALRHPNPAAIRKAHVRALNAIVDVLRTAATISTPATKDNADSIEEQRLLSPESENKLAQIRNWKLLPLLSEEPAIELLASDVEAALRRKLSAVNRMINTIVYVETVRMEWEQRVDDALAERQGTDLERHSSISSGQVDNSEKADETAVGSVGSSHPSGSQQDAVEDGDGDESAVLLEHYENEVPPDSTTLSAKEGGREEDIPGLEGAMGGGSLVDAIPIPQRTNAFAMERVRSMHRDKSITSSSSTDTNAAVPGSLLAPAPSRSRRQSELTGEREVLQTPPMSPRDMPLESGSASRQKDRRTSHSLRTSIGAPLSPRIPPAAPSSRPTASSITDFDIIKPISKGAFGSVFLAKKRTTGDYYAIKVLKKSDMIAKNQITNVKAERMILMTQAQSPFVVKLFFTFQSSENLYLVMEYLPGGDCASLVKALGGVSEDWAKQFLAEVVNGLEMLHARGVVHRDMKPDNLLIDQRGHLKLTDFGLSKIGLLGRQNRQQQLHAKGGRSSIGSAEAEHGKHDSVSSTSTTQSRQPAEQLIESRGRMGHSIPEAPGSTNILASQPFYVGTPTHVRGRIMSASTDVMDAARGSESAFAGAQAQMRRLQSVETPMESPRQSFGIHLQAATEAGSDGMQSTGGSGGQLKRFVGTPDYLAPESILGLGMDDAAVDWWAVGVILYELLYGFPPFHAETPEKVFDNILSRKIEWEDEDVDFSAEARDLMERLMCTDRKNRLGVNGAQEIKAHPFFAGIDWDNLVAEDGPFVPQVTDPESTDYFDLRGAVYQDLHNDGAAPPPTHGFAEAIAGNPRMIQPKRPPTRNRVRSSKHAKEVSETQADEFGSFSFKNLPVLKQANDEVIKKMRGDQLSSMSAAMMEQQLYASAHSPQQAAPQVTRAGRAPPQATQQTQTQAQQNAVVHQRHRSVSGMIATPSSHRNSAILLANAGPPSPSTSVSSMSSAPSKSTAPTSPSGVPLYYAGASLHNTAYMGASQAHRRRPSEFSLGPMAGVSGSPTTSSSSSGNSALASFMDRKRSQLANEDTLQRGVSSAAPARIRATSVGGELLAAEQPQGSVPWNLQVPIGMSGGPQSGKSGSSEISTGVADTGSTAGGLGLIDDSGSVPAAAAATAKLACMVAEDNPISQRMLEDVLVKLGCDVVCVRNGAEALRLAMGEDKFAILFIDATLPIVSGQDVARMVRSTRNSNSSTPIVALARPEEGSASLAEGSAGADSLSMLLQSSGGVFDDVLTKPFDRADVCALLPRLGFQALSVAATQAAPKSSPVAEAKGLPGAGPRRSTIAHAGGSEGVPREERV